MTKKYELMSTDELLEIMPDNLQLARNDNADPDGKWRAYNRCTDNYCEPGFPTAKAMMIFTLEAIDAQHEAWTQPQGID